MVEWEMVLRGGMRICCDDEELWGSPAFEEEESGRRGLDGETELETERWRVCSTSTIIITE